MSSRASAGHPSGGQNIMATASNERGWNAAGKAEYSLMREYRKFVQTISEAERADFFDGRNSDCWMRSFAEFLSRPREFASND
jgi:hypothetical protein